MKDERHDRFIQYLSSIEAVSFLKSSSLECLYRYLRYPRNSNFNLFNTNPIQDAQLVLDYSTSYIILWRSSPCLWSDADPEPWVEMTHQWTTRWPKPAEAFTEQLVTTTKIPNVRPMSFKLGAFKAFLSSKPLVVVLVFFQKLGLAGLGCLSFSCSSRACRPKLMNRWLLLSHARLCATPSHQVTRYRIGSLKSSATSISTMPWASGRSTKEHTKGLRPGWCFRMVFDETDETVTSSAGDWVR